MIWKIADFEFDQERRLLVSDKSTIELEPKATALLAYFCQHSHRDISRDELIERVWRGQIVSDNAVNRVIVQLRKAFADEHTPRRYIATLPKFGYRFIAPVKALSTPQSDKEHEQANRNHHHPGLLLILSVLIALSVALAFYRYWPKASSAANGPLISPLSRLSTWQYDADLSPDLTKLVYSISTDHGSVLFLDVLGEQATQAIGLSDGEAHSARWSNDGRKLVYQYHKDKTCEIHLLDFDQEQQARVLQKCIPGIYTPLAFSPDDQVLYFLERKNAFAPYEVFAFDLEQQHKWRLSQPPVSGIGNHYFDVNPETGELLIVADQMPGISSVFEIDVIDRSYKKLLQLDYGLNSAIWGHRQGTIVHPGRHPSYQLIETNLASGQSTTLLSDSRRIINPQRINNNRDYLFTSYLYNRDLSIEGLSTDALNSTVMDYLPKLSHSGEQLAFVSKRSGYSKVWIKQLPKGGLISIEPDDNGRAFYSLSWSFDDKRILANSSQGLLVFDVHQKAVVATLSPQHPVYAASWTGANEISYSTYDDDKWHLQVVDGELQNPTRVAGPWAFTIANADRRYYLDQSLQLISEAGDLLDDLVCGELIFRYYLNVHLDGDKLYCVAPDGSGDLQMWQPGNDLEIRAGEVSRSAYFSIRNERIVKTMVANAYSDIMRTEFAEEVNQ